MGNTNLYQVAFLRDLTLAVREGIGVRTHTFMDSKTSPAVDIGRRENGEKNMLIVHKQVPSSDFKETEEGQRLMRGILISPAGKQPFWGQLQHNPEEAYVVLLAPTGSVSFDYEEAVATQGVTDTLDVYLIKLRQGFAGGVIVTITGDDGRDRSHSITFEEGELRSVEVATPAQPDEPEVEE